MSPPLSSPLSKGRKVKPTENKPFLKVYKKIKELETIRDSLDKDFLSTYYPDMLSKVRRARQDIQNALKVLEEIQISGNDQHFEKQILVFKYEKAIKSIREYTEHRSNYNETQNYNGRLIIFFYISLIAIVNFSLFCFLYERSFNNNNHNLLLL